MIFFLPVICLVYLPRGAKRGFIITHCKNSVLVYWKCNLPSIFFPLLWNLRFLPAANLPALYFNARFRILHSICYGQLGVVSLSFESRYLIPILILRSSRKTCRTVVLTNYARFKKRRLRVMQETGEHTITTFVSLMNCILRAEDL